MSSPITNPSVWSTAQQVAMSATFETLTVTVQVPTMMTQASYTLTTGSATQIVGSSGMRSVEIFNSGPNPILVGPSTGTLLRPVASSASFPFDFSGSFYAKATVADQTGSLVTIVTILS